MRNLLLGLPLVLAACASPYQRCVGSANKDIRVLNQLIATTQANISRGYAIRTEEYFDTEQQVCGEVDGEPVYCDVPVPQEREVPVALDLDAERAKLQSLLKARDEKATQAVALAQQCRQLHPEG